MKKIFLQFFIFLPSFTSGFAQWQPDVRLTYNDSLSFLSGNNEWCVAASGNFVHVVWSDLRYGHQIYYKRSTDGGTIWESDIQISNGPIIAKIPSIAVSGSIVYIVWLQLGGNSGKYYIRSTDNGQIWSSAIRITASPSEHFSLSASGTTLHFTWIGPGTNYGEVWYKNSTDEGLSWGTDMRLTYDNAIQRYPAISTSGPIVLIVFEDDRDGGITHIYSKRSTDAGATWGPDTRVTGDPSFAWCPCVSISGLTANIVWIDTRNGPIPNEEIYCRSSTDGGVNWGSDTRLTNDPARAYFPSVWTSGINVHVAWRDTRDGNREIYYKHSSNRGQSWETDTRLTNNTASSDYPSVCSWGSSIHVVWQDYRDGNGEVYYKRNPTGNIIKIIKINSELPKEFNLSQNYPNPFNPTTKIKFSIPLDPRLRGNDNVLLKVCDALGGKVQTLVNESLQPGTYEVDFDGTNYPSGIYFYTLTTETYTNTKRMVLLK